MRKFSETLLSMWDHPRRMLIVITVTCIVGLVTIAAATDEYSTLREEKTDLSLQLARAQLEADSLPAARRQLQRREQDLAAARRLGVSSQQVHELRSRLVAEARETGCTVRRLHLANPQIRPWTHDDDPHRSRVDRKAKPTGFQLRTQVVNLTVTGTSEEIDRLLKQIADLGHVVDGRRLAVHAAGSNRSQVVMETELRLYNLETDTERKMALPAGN